MSRLFVISGPSGCGKNTVYEGLLKKSGNIAQTVSATTRLPRDGETDGVDYYFMTADRFLSLADEGAFVEYVNYGGNYYGTLKSEIERLTSLGKDVVLVIEVNGALNIKKAFPDAVTVFLVPPSLDELEKRLRGRGTETEEVISKRIDIARSELAMRDKYDHTVVNGDLDTCIAEVYSLMNSRQGENYHD